VKNFDELIQAYENLIETADYRDYKKLWDEVRGTAKKIRIEFSTRHPNTGIHTLAMRYHQVLGSTTSNVEDFERLREAIIASGLSSEKVDEIVSEINKEVEEKVGVLLIQAGL